MLTLWKQQRRIPKRPNILPGHKKCKIVYCFGVLKHSFVSEARDPKNKCKQFPKNIGSNQGGCHNDCPLLNITKGQSGTTPFSGPSQHLLRPKGGARSCWHHHLAPPSGHPWNFLRIFFEITRRRELNTLILWRFPSGGPQECNTIWHHLRHRP